MDTIGSMIMRNMWSGPVPVTIRIETDDGQLRSAEFPALIEPGETVGVSLGDLVDLAGAPIPDGARVSLQYPKAKEVFLYQRDSPRTANYSVGGSYSATARFLLVD